MGKNYVQNEAGIWLPAKGGPDGETIVRGTGPDGETIVRGTGPDGEIDVKQVGSNVALRVQVDEKLDFTVTANADRLAVESFEFPEEYKYFFVEIKSDASHNFSVKYTPLHYGGTFGVQLGSSEDIKEISSNNGGITDNIAIRSKEMHIGVTNKSDNDRKYDLWLWGVK